MHSIIKHDKRHVVLAIERNITVLNAVVLLIVFILFFLNVKFLFKILDYIPSDSLVTMIVIVAGLVLVSLYLSKRISKNAIEEFKVYDNQLSNALTSLRNEIQEREKTEERLEDLILYDQLTGLPNREQFIRRLSRIGERPKEHKGYLFAVLFVDLDNFKILNDSLGQAIGNQLLIAVVKRMRMCIRSVDILARFGGDEFVVLLDNIKNTSDVLLFIKRVQKKFKKAFNLDGHDVFTTASIGIALSSTGYDDVENLIRDSEIAMHHAKDKGKSCYEMFDTDMHNSIMKRLKLEADLRQAIRRRELFLHYQPIVSLQKRKIVGAEALIRWQHPEFGFIPPMEFIPIAEDTGLIIEIGEWVLRTACVQNKAWHGAGYNYLRIDVNFSSRQFHSSNILERIKKVLRETGMQANMLDIEITESIAMEDHSIEVLNELSNLKITTSVDDFGTGHSSLGSLKRLPINALKIDKSFIKDVSIDSDSEAIVKAIIALAHNLNLKVVAEGVETEEQLELLQLNHCDEIQGYLYSPPVSVEKFTELLEQKNTRFLVAHEK